MANSYKLGKREPREDLRTFKMAKYATPSTVPPRRMDWSLGVNKWGPMKNDEIGDCTVAAIGHMVQAWTNNNGAEIVIPDEEIVRAYSDITGYVPGDDSTDNGAVVLDVLNYARRNGVGGHKIAGYVALSPHNRDHVALSIDLLGGCYLGVALPVSAQDQEVWSVLNDDPNNRGRRGSWGGHAVPALNYGPTGVVVLTWGKLVTLSWEFFDAYVDEAYGVLSPDWATTAKNAPSGFNFAQLQEDMKWLGA